MVQSGWHFLVLDINFLEDLNDFFGNLCHDSEYVDPNYVDIDPGTVIAPVLDEYQVMLALSKIKKSEPGPDGIPHWVWKENADLLAPVITAIWNLSLKKHAWPSAWKQANINSLPKVHTPLEYQDYRGIDVTPITARCFERTVYRTFSKSVFKVNLISSQFAYGDGCNCTDAPLKLQYNCLKALDDTETDAVRLYAMYLSKAFDNVRHFLLSQKLKAPNLIPYLIKIGF